MGGHHTRDRRLERRNGHTRPAARPVVVELTVEESELVSRSVNGTGGMQGVLLRLVARMTKDRRLVLTPAEVETIRRYAFEYGGGGYQDRFRALSAAIEREEETRGNRV